MSRARKCPRVPSITAYRPLLQSERTGAIYLAEWHEAPASMAKQVRRCSVCESGWPKYYLVEPLETGVDVALCALCARKAKLTVQDVELSRDDGSIVKMPILLYGSELVDLITSQPNILAYYSPKARQ